MFNGQIPVSRTISDKNLCTKTAIEIRIAKIQSEPINALTQGRIKFLQNRLKVEFKNPQTVVLSAVAGVCSTLLAGKEQKEEGCHAY